MNRRTFLLSAAGAGLGLFVPKRLVTVFDMGRRNRYDHYLWYFYSREHGQFRRFDHVWQHLQKDFTWHDCLPGLNPCCQLEHSEARLVNALAYEQPEPTPICAKDIPCVRL